MGRCLAGTFLLFSQKTTVFKAGRCGALPRRDVLFSQTNAFSKQGAPVRGVASQGRFFAKQGAPVWGVASQGCLTTKTTSFSFLDTTFRVNVAKS